MSHELIEVPIDLPGQGPQLQQVVVLNRHPFEGREYLICVYLHEVEDPDAPVMIVRHENGRYLFIADGELRDFCDHMDEVYGTEDDEE